MTAGAGRPKTEPRLRPTLWNFSELPSGWFVFHVVVTARRAGWTQEAIFRHRWEASRNTHQMIQHSVAWTRRHGAVVRPGTIVQL